jgi:capsular exopolysaccharide synthesis family protein
MEETTTLVTRNGNEGLTAVSGMNSPFWNAPQLPNSEELSLLEIWRTLFKRKLVVFGVLAATMLLVGAYTLHKTPLYEGVARIEIDPNRAPNLGLEDLIQEKLSSSDSSSVLQTEVRILQSDAVATQVMNQVDWPDKKGYGRGTGQTMVSQLSPILREKMIDRFRNNLKVQVVPNTQIVELRFRDPDPKLATNVTNAFVDAYIERNFKTRYQSTMQVSDWLSKQMDDLRTRAAEAQDKLAEFQKRNNILGADENDNIVTDKLRQLNQQLTDAEADRIVKEARHRLASSGNPELIASVVPSSTLQVLRTQQADLKQQFAQLTTKFGSGYPKVREMQGQLDRIDNEISDEVKTLGQRIDDEYLASEKTQDMLRSRFDAQKQQAFQLNESAAQYALLRHEVESSRELYDSLQVKLKEAGVTAGLSSTNVTVVDRADIPGKPVEPKVPLNLALGLLGGLVGGVSLAFVLESLDDSITTSEEVEAVAALPALCSIPMIQNGTLRPVRGALPGIEANNGHDLITIRKPNSGAAEAYRSLRSSILLTSIDEPPKLIVVTSAFPQEGKTTTSANTAVALAQRGGRVLLVDADMRRSSLYKKFGMDQTIGLSTVLQGGSVDEAITTPLAELPNLHVLPAGPIPVAPAELLASLRMRTLLRKWTQEFEHVVIDTPPVFPVTDALILASQADAVLLVVRSGVTRKKALLRMRDVLQRANAPIIGVALNGVNMRLEHYYAGSYRYGNYADGYYHDDQAVS